MLAIDSECRFWHQKSDLSESFPAKNNQLFPPSSFFYPHSLSVTLLVSFSISTLLRVQEIIPAFDFPGLPLLTHSSLSVSTCVSVILSHFCVSVYVKVAVAVFLSIFFYVSSRLFCLFFNWSIHPWLPFVILCHTVWLMEEMLEILAIQPGIFEIGSICSNFLAFTSFHQQRHIAKLWQHHAEVNMLFFQASQSTNQVTGKN